MAQGVVRHGAGGLLLLRAQVAPPQLVQGVDRGQVDLVLRTVQREVVGGEWGVEAVLDLQSRGPREEGEQQEQQQDWGSHAEPCGVC
ncbi:hypothetical protein FKM82_004395 [Ascaphus truei]